MKIWAKTDGEVREGKYLVVRRDGTIPNWPHFVIGGDDYAGPEGLLAYAAEARRLGYDPAYCDSIAELADDFATRAVNQAALAAQSGTKGADPDAPPHRKDNPAVVAMMRGEGDLSRYVAPTTPPAEEEREALEGYRAASHYIGADAWDGCSDCMEILRLAAEADSGRDMSADAIAGVLKRLRGTPADPTPPGGGEKPLVKALDLIRELAVKSRTGYDDAATIHSIAFCALRDYRAAPPHPWPGEDAIERGADEFLRIYLGEEGDEVAAMRAALNAIHGG